MNILEGVENSVLYTGGGFLIKVNFLIVWI